MVGEFVDDEVLAVFKRWYHRRTRDDEGLCNKKTHRDDDTQCNERELKEFGEKNITTLRYHGNIVVTLAHERKYLQSTEHKKDARKTSEWYSFCMSWTVVGLGNPGEEYVGTRHNVGRDLLCELSEKIPKKIKLLTLDSFMNESGGPVKKFFGAAPSKKTLAQLVVVHDDLDLPLGRVKISFGSGAGGHRGVASIQKALKTRDFVRVRLGISPATPSGKLKKPNNEAVVDFVLGHFKPKELDILKKTKKTVAEALELLVDEGLAAAVMQIHTKQ